MRSGWTCIVWLALSACASSVPQTRDPDDVAQQLGGDDDKEVQTTPATTATEAVTGPPIFAGGIMACRTIPVPPGPPGQGEGGAVPVGSGTAAPGDPAPPDGGQVTSTEPAAPGCAAPSTPGEAEQAASSEPATMSDTMVTANVPAGADGTVPPPAVAGAHVVVVIRDEASGSTIACGCESASGSATGTPDAPAPGQPLPPDEPAPGQPDPPAPGLPPIAAGGGTQASTPTAPAPGANTPASTTTAPAPGTVPAPGNPPPSAPSMPAVCVERADRCYTNGGDVEVCESIAVCCAITAPPTAPAPSVPS